MRKYGNDYRRWTIFAKSYIKDDWKSSKYAFEIVKAVPDIFIFAFDLFFAIFETSIASSSYFY